MKLADYKLVVSDLDGTLVKSGTDVISGAAINVINTLKEQGILFTIATGRGWAQSRKIVGELGITLPVILQSGAIVADPVTGKVIQMQPLRRTICDKLTGIHHFSGIDRFFLSEDGTYYTMDTVITDGGKSFLARSGELCRIGKRPDSLRPVVKHLFIGPEKAIQQLKEAIFQKISPRPNMILWPPEEGNEDFFLEVFDPGASKGRAVKWLSGYLRIKRKQVIAFGDGYNDADLLSWAGLGVAMEDAPALVTSQAKMVIPGPEQDGLARFLDGEFFSYNRKGSY